MNEKFQELKHKISCLTSLNTKNSRFENISTNQNFIFNSKIEKRFQYLEELYISSIKTLDLKFMALKEHINKLNEYLEVNAIKDDNNKTEVLENLAFLIKHYENMLIEDNKKMIISMDNIFSKMNNRLINIDKKEGIKIEQNLANSEEAIQIAEIDLPVINKKVHQNQDEFKNKIDIFKNDISNQQKAFYNEIQDLSTNTNNFFQEQNISLSELANKTNQDIINEKRAKENFKFNIHKVLNETIDSLSNF